MTSSRILIIHSIETGTPASCTATSATTPSSPTSWRTRRTRVQFGPLRPRPLRPGSRPGLAIAGFAGLTAGYG